MPKTILDDLISLEGVEPRDVTSCHAMWSCLLSVGNALSTAYSLFWLRFILEHSTLSRMARHHQVGLRIQPMPHIPNFAFNKWHISRNMNNVPTYVRSIATRLFTLIAFLTLMSEFLTTSYSLLNRPISWTRTVFMLCSYLVGYRRFAASVSKLFGSFFRMSSATSSTISSVDLPPPEAALAWNIK